MAVEAVLVDQRSKESKASQVEMVLTAELDVMATLVKMAPLECVVLLVPQAPLALDL